MTNQKAPKSPKVSKEDVAVRAPRKSLKVKAEEQLLPHQCLEVEDICMRNSSAYIHADFQPFPFKNEPIENTIHYMTGLKRVSIYEGENETGGKESYYVYTARMGVRIVRAGAVAAEASNDEILMHIEADYDAIYKLREDCEPIKQEDAQNFGERNAPFHVWPFFREHISSAMQKMGLKPLILPMYFSDPGKMGSNAIEK